MYAGCGEEAMQRLTKGARQGKARAVGVESGYAVVAVDWKQKTKVSWTRAG